METGLRIAIGYVALVGIVVILVAARRKAQKRNQDFADLKARLAAFTPLCQLAQQGHTSAAETLAGSHWEAFVANHPECAAIRAQALEKAKAIEDEFKGEVGLAAIEAYQAYIRCQGPAAEQLRLLRNYVAMHRGLSVWARRRLRMLFSTDWSRLAEGFSRLAQQALNEYLAAARKGDRQAFLDAQALIAASHEDRHDMFAMVWPISGLLYPADWNELLIRFVFNPRLNQFADTPGIDLDDLVALCAETLNNKSVFWAKLLLAHYNANRQVREILGGYLAIQLAGVAIEHGHVHNLPMPGDE